MAGNVLAPPLVHRFLTGVVKTDGTGSSRRFDDSSSPHLSDEQTPLRLCETSGSAADRADGLPHSPRADTRRPASGHARAIAAATAWAWIAISRSNPVDGCW